MAHTTNATSGNDNLSGTDTDDTLSYLNGVSGTQGVLVSLAVTVAQDTGGSGVDTLQGFENLTGSNFDDDLTGDDNDNVLSGLRGHDILFGAGGVDTLIGGNGGDTLNGGAGDDELRGNLGNDTYVVDGLGDSVFEGVDAGIDQVNSVGLDARLAGNVENGRIAATGASDMTGNSLDNLIFAGMGDNRIAGGAGVDTLSYQFGVTGSAGVRVRLDDAGVQATGGSGNDQVSGFANLTGSQNDDFLAGNDAANELRGLGGDDRLFGGGGNDTLLGGAGDDELDGQVGLDEMRGGTGDDTYGVRQEGDVVIELADQGTADTVRSFVGAYTLTDNVENARIAAAGAANLTGNASDNLIEAGTGDNVIDGGAGTDTLSYEFGAAGSAGVFVSLAQTGAQATGGSGSDTVLNFENLTGSNNDDGLIGDAGPNVLIGLQGNDSLTGGGGDDTLIGNAGNDSLEGAAGADEMRGGVGDDIYVVRQAGDNVVEFASGGHDLVESFLASYTLGAQVEDGRIMLAGAADLNGNDLDNAIFAGAGDNVMTGGAGEDTVSYAFADAGVTVNLETTTAQATGGSGTDTLTGFENLTGSDFDDFLRGDALDNRLEGRRGDDDLIGGQGNDAILGGRGADLLEGGGGADLLIGGSDNDILRGRVGEDTLVGGGGADNFDFNLVTDTGISLATADLIRDFVRGDDVVDLATIDADTTAANNQAFTFIGAADFDTTDAAGQLRYEFNVATNTGMLLGSTDADADAEFVIEVAGVPAMTGADFVL